MVYAKFGGQTECIMGNWKIENRGRVSFIIGKTVPIFRRPKREDTLCGGVSALREVKLIVLSCAMRVSFWVFYKLST